MTLNKSCTARLIWANRQTCSVKVCTSAAIWQRTMICIGSRSCCAILQTPLRITLKALPRSTRNHIACY